MLDKSPLNEHFDLPARAVLAFLNAREISKVQIIWEDDSAIGQHLAYFKCDAGAAAKYFALNIEELSQAQSVLANTFAHIEDETVLDRMKAVEQILRAVEQPLKDAKEYGLLVEDVPVWHLQPYLRDWDLYPEPVVR